MAVQQGRDPRTLTDDIVRHLRDCFLSLMAPELVQLSTQRAAEVSDLAHRLGAANAVRFEQASAASQVLNRVTGNDPSAIFGSRR